MAGCASCLFGKSCFYPCVLGRGPEQEGGRGGCAEPLLSWEMAWQAASRVMLLKCFFRLTLSAPVKEVQASIWVATVWIEPVRCLDLGGLGSNPLSHRLTG